MGQMAAWHGIMREFNKRINPLREGQVQQAAHVSPNGSRMKSLSPLRRQGHQHEPVLVSKADDLPFDYSIVRARRKTLAVYVRYDRVEVRAPLGVSQADIAVFVRQHLAWINRKLAHKAQQSSELLRVEDGAAIFYKARNLRIVFEEASRQGVEVRGAELLILGRRLDGPRARKILENWLLEQARAYLPQRTRALAAYLKVEHRLSEVVFRKTRSKWGHCTASGRIQYNWLIMLAPDAIIDYMICHETCHLLQMNHSAAYWRLVESVCPDYRQYVAWLKQHEHRLWPSQDAATA